MRVSWSGPMTRFMTPVEVKILVGVPKRLWWPCRGGLGEDNCPLCYLKGYYGRDSPRWPGQMGPDRDLAGTSPEFYSKGSLSFAARGV